MEGGEGKDGFSSNCFFQRTPKLGDARKSGTVLDLHAGDFVLPSCGGCCFDLTLELALKASWTSALALCRGGWFGRDGCDMLVGVPHLCFADLCGVGDGGKDGFPSYCYF